MDAYSVFAEYYDALTENVEYSKRADYLLEVLNKLGHKPKLALDLACGTGSLTLELFKRGIDIYGVDSSVEMLTMAREKFAENNADILLLCQEMQYLDLYGSVDTVFCTLDSLNHLNDINEVEQCFSRVSTFLDPDGWFVFDMNTPYKHREILGNNTFVYDVPDIYCVWQNSYTERDNTVQIDLDLFPFDGEFYDRYHETFEEKAYPQETIEKLLKKCGFAEIHTYNELTFDLPKCDTQRIVYAAKKA